MCCGSHRAWSQTTPSKVVYVIMWLQVVIVKKKSQSPPPPPPQKEVIIKKQQTPSPPPPQQVVIQKQQSAASSPSPPPPPATTTQVHSLRLCVLMLIVEDTVFQVQSLLPCRSITHSAHNQGPPGEGSVAALRRDVSAQLMALPKSRKPADELMAHP